MPVNIQHELTDLQCDSDLKDKFASVGLDTFFFYHLLPGYPKMTALAVKVLCMFGITYLREVFFVMNINKTKLLSMLTHKHLNYILKLAAAQDLAPDIDALVKA